jgi:pimeloyl-ACP methyl ester carboxylesterase
MAEGYFASSTAAGPHNIFYQTWGDPYGQPLVCVHGLTGSSQDFKYIGEYLSPLGYYTVALDVPGRGKSDFLKNPDDYKFDQYFKDIRAFLAHLNLTKVDWLGVSMGGLLGIHIAGEENSPIQRLILSDVGPEVPQGALDFIAGYLTLSPVFSSIPDVVNALKSSKGTPFYRGDMDEEQWTHYARTHVRQNDAGLWTRAFDSKIANNFYTQPLGQEDLWTFWDRITQPVLLIRGQLSVLLTEEIANRMDARKTASKMDFITIEGAGHVPSLYTTSQIKLLYDWLQTTSAA